VAPDSKAMASEEKRSKNARIIHSADDRRAPPNLKKARLTRLTRIGRSQATQETMTTINVEVQRTIRRPLAVVSRQFGDIQHHSRDHVHPDIKFTVLSEDGDICHFRQEVKLVGIKQTDEVVQRRNADGSLSWDVVDGANKGMRIYQGFTPVSAEATMVTFRAEAPATGIKGVLKPLFEIAIRRAVEKGFEEDRVDLEERGYGASTTNTATSA